MKLHIRDDDGRLTIVPLVRDSITIGRSEGNTIRLTERNVSRQHARLMHDGDILYVEEVKPRYGTRLNGDLIGGKTPVSPGDVIEIGDYQLALHEDTTEMAAKTTCEMPAIGRDDTPIAIPVPPDLGDPNAVTAMINLADLPATAEEQDKKDIPREQQARLVILSPQLAGVEHVITETPTVIGRTADHNFQIDHRSISRNHAMITYDNGGYTLHDMASSNGLKVNGEFYRKVDLHAGDELELGHVKVRFVAAGEQFVVGNSLDEDDYPVAMEAPASPVTKIVVLVAALITVAVVGFWFFGDHILTPNNEPNETQSTTLDTEASAVDDDETIDEAENVDNDPVENVVSKPATAPIDDKDDEPAETDNESNEKAEDIEGDENTNEGVDDENAIDDAPKVDEKAVPEPQPKSVDDTPKAEEKPSVPKANAAIAEAATLGSRARAEYRNGNLTKAVSLAEKALTMDKHQSTAQSVLNQVKADRAAYSILKKTQQAREKSDWKTVLKQSNKGINRSPNSDIKSQLRSLRDEAKKELSTAAVSRGDSFAAKKKWNKALRAYKEAKKYDRKNANAAAGIRKANQALSEKKTPQPEPSSGNSKLEQAKNLYKQATAAKYNGDLGSAEKLYRQCLTTHPGMASCRAALVPLLMSRGKVCDAVKHMRRYVKAYPGAKKTPNFKKLIETFEARCN